MAYNRGWGTTLCETKNGLQHALRKDLEDNGSEFPWFCHGQRKGHKNDTIQYGADFNGFQHCFTKNNTWEHYNSRRNTILADEPGDIAHVYTFIMRRFNQQQMRIRPAFSSRCWYLGRFYPRQ